MAKTTTQETAPDLLRANPKSNKELDLALQQITKDYGDGAIMRLGDRKVMDVEVIPTGNILIDRALGVGGVPRGRIVEIYGPESSGKTTVALTLVAQAQKKGGSGGVHRRGARVRPDVYARKLGVNPDELLISQPSSGEEASADLRNAGAFQRAGHHHR